MAGNPFRRPQVDTQTTSQIIPKKKIKKVQFVSPIASPSEPFSHPRFPALEDLENGPKSPPPTGSDYDGIDTKALLRGDLTAGGTIDLEANEKLYNASVASTAANTPISPTPPPFQLGQPPPGRRGPPANPFARTLANMDASSPSEPNSAEGKKGGMDVDAFKRLLLTGKVDMETSGPTTATDGMHSPQKDNQWPGTIQPGSISATTQSSTAPSDEESSDESVSTTDDEDERAIEGSPSIDVDEQRRTLTAPVPDSGSANFDDFDDLQPSIDENENAEPSPQNDSRNRSESDLNKPLPQPPDQSQLGLDVPPSPSAMPGTPTLAKRSQQAPPPPTSRRHGTGTGPGTGPTRSRSSSDASSLAPVTADIHDDASQPNKLRPPPPRAPPSRLSSKEVKRLSDQPPHSRTASTTSVVSDSKPEPQPKLKPPPPPSRASSKQTPHSQRTPSSSSSISQRKTSPATGGPAPPPPPRPRRGESRQASAEASSSATNADASIVRRHSGTSFDSQRRDSVSSLQRVTEERPEATDKTPTETALKVDMLADLDAFQRDIDALRAKAFAGK